MAQRTRTVLKGYFETGDVPTQAQFEDLIDSQANITDDGTPLTDASAFATAAQGAKADTATQPADLAPYLTSATAASTYEPLKGADDNYVTDAEKVVIGNTSGTNTGDQDISGIATNAAAISALDTAKEDALGNPSTNGEILSSTTGGVRSWITLGGGGDMVKSTYDPANKAEQVLTIGDSGDFATAAQGVLADTAVQNADFNIAHSILVQQSGTGTPTPLSVPSSSIVGNNGGGDIVALTPTQVRTMINVENGADVTDATNVTAAGALMDSEVTNLAAVKAFDPTDYATAAQGALADSAQQPPSEGAFVNGDKTKLDGIAAGAEVNTVTLTNTATLTNKRITMRVQAVASAATVTPSWDNDDCVTVTAQAAALELANPSGTPTSMQPITIRIKDDGTARAISYGTQYRGIGVTLPTTTVISKTLYLGGMWNAADSKFDIIGYALEA